MAEVTRGQETKTERELAQEASAIAAGLPPTPPSPYEETVKFRAEKEAEKKEEVTGKVEETRLSPGAVAGKETAKKVHPELVELVESGAPAKEIYELASRTSGSYAAGVREQLASQFRAASELENKEQFEAYQKLGVIEEGAAYAGTENGKLTYFSPDQVDLINKQIDLLESQKLITPDYAKTLRGKPLSEILTTINIKMRQLSDIQKADILTRYGKATGASIEELKAMAKEIEKKGIAPVARYVETKELKAREKAIADIERIAPGAITRVNREVSIDIRKALAAGISEATLRSAGVDYKNIRETEAFQERIDDALDALSDYKTDKGYELSRAFAEGKGKLVYNALSAGLFTPEQVLESQFAAIKTKSAELARTAKFKELGLEDYKVSTFSEAKLKEEVKELGSLYSVEEIRKKRDEIARGVGADITGYNLAKYFRDHAWYTKDNKVDLDRLNKLEKDLVAAGFDAKQVRLARVAAFASPAAKIEPITKEKFEEKRPGWASGKVMAIQQWQNELQESMAKLPTDNVTYNLVLTTGGALVVTAATLLTAIPSLTLRVIDKPLSTPELLKDVATGMGRHILNTASNTLAGKYGQDWIQGNAFPAVYDTTMTFLIVRGGIKLGKGIVSRVTTYLHPRGVPASVIAKEVSTGRIKISQEQFAKAYADAINQAEKLAMTKGGKFSGSVPIKGTPFELRYLKTPLQQRVGNILFHGTKDEIVKGTVVKPSALRLAETQGGLVAPKGGIYTSPWAAIGYTRGGENPGLLMVVTNAAKFRSGAKGLAKGITPKETFIKGATKGFYGSSKTWRGDLETEVVFAPRTRLTAPPPTATGLLNRMITGNYADFFTYDAGKFVPIKIAVDTASLGKGAFNAMTPANLYAVKLYSLYGGLRDAAVSLKHPALVLKDISGTIRELVKLDNWIRESGKGGLTMPGLRDVYLITNYGAKIKGIATRLWNEAFRRTKTQLPKTRVDSATFRAALERNMDSVYRANASSLISAFKDVATAYTASETDKAKFEASYIANLGMSVEALAKSSSLSESAIETALIDTIKSYPISEAQKTQLISSLKRASEASVVSIESMASSLRDKETRPVSEIIKGKRIEERPISRVAESPVERTIREIEERPIERVVSEIREPTIKEPIIREPREPITEEPREPTPREPITEEPPEEEPPPPPVVLPFRRPEAMVERMREVQLPEGTIAFKMGALWKYLTPPWTQRKFLTLPKGAVPTGAVNTDLRSPYQTIQMIGKPRAEVPETISGDLGITDFEIYNYGRNIHFAGRGTLTNVGERLESPTKGMSIPSVGIEEYRFAEVQTKPKRRPFRRPEARKYGRSRKKRNSLYEVTRPPTFSEIMG